MKAHEELTISDPKPLRLRTVDLADPQALMIECADLARALNAQLLYLRGIAHDQSTDRERLIYRIQRESTEAHEASGRVQDAIERASKRLRATGRL